MYDHKREPEKIAADERRILERYLWYLTTGLVIFGIVDSLLGRTTSWLSWAMSAAIFVGPVFILVKSSLTEIRVRVENIDAKLDKIETELQRLGEVIGQSIDDAEAARDDERFR